MNRWDELRKRGDWVFIEGKAPEEVSSSLNNYLRYHYGPGCVYTSRFVEGEGTFVALAHMPDGVVEAADLRRKNIRSTRQDTINEMHGRAEYDPSGDVQRKHDLAKAMKELDEADDPFSDENLAKINGEEDD